MTCTAGEVPAAVSRWDGNKGEQAAMDHLTERPTGFAVPNNLQFLLTAFWKIHTWSLLEAVGKFVVIHFFCSYYVFIFISV